MTVVTMGEVRGGDSPDDRTGPLVESASGFPAPRAGKGVGCHKLYGDDDVEDDTAGVTPTAQEKVFVGFDTEWERDRRGTSHNHVLAYGLHVRSGGKSSSLIVKSSGRKRSQRQSLNRLVGRGLEKAIDQETIPGWPEEIVLAVHYGRGDLAACKDFKTIKPDLSAVRGTLTTRGRPVALDVDIDEKSGMPVDRLPKLPRSLSRDLLDAAGNQHKVLVHVRDTFCLAPGGASLDAIGELLGYRKLALPEGYHASDMGRFLAERPEEFDAYLKRDAEITARYAQRFAGFAAEIGLPEMPSTLGAAAVAMLHDEFKEMGLDRRELFAKTRVTKIGYSRVTHRRLTRREEVLNFDGKLIDGAAGDAYSGGRTETFLTGPVAGPLCDIDLRSAYPTAMAAIGVIDYGGCRIAEHGDLSLFTADTASFAEVDFETPATVPFPVFGVRTERGLIFPRVGRTVATAPEIAAAVHLGVSVKIVRGFIIPWDASVRPYERFVVRMLKLRDALKRDGKDTLESKMVKEMTNSVYGKTAQGVREASQYDVRSGRSKRLGRSSVTSPVLAAYTTGLVRATVAELLNSIPHDKRVVSVSTDGFLTSADIADLGLDGPAVRVMLAARRRIAAQTGGAAQDGAGMLLEVKKRAVEVVAFRNRGIATTAAAPGSDPVLAKNGIKVPRGRDPNHFLLDLYLNRGHETRIERSDLISLREQMEEGADLVSVLRNPLVNFEPDMKRRLVRAADAAVGHGDFAGVVHLATESEPFGTVEEALGERATFEAWRDAQKRPLKTMDDWRAWQDYRAAASARRRSGGRVRVTAGGSADVLKRQFLRALVQGECGIALDGRTHRDVAEWLTVAGYKTTVAAVKNATRPGARLAEGAVAATDTTLELLRVLLAEFPLLDVGRLFAPGEVDRVRAYLAEIGA